MAENKNWEFDCPQFFDFCNGVEENTVNIQSLGGDSPALEDKFNFRSKNIMKNRSAAWNNKLSTPVTFVNINHRQTNITDSEKLHETKKRLSKSEGSVNILGVCNKVFKKDGSCYPSIIHKRSLSDGNLRPKKKFPATPKKIPATPMCLKRTMMKDKAKKIKTTEELELEKIAELQSLTLKHLRLNEMNMKKLKLKPKPPTVPKIAALKGEKKEKSAPMKKFQKDLEEVIERLNSNTNARFAVPNPAKRAERLGAVSSISDVELISSTHTLQPSVSGLLNEVQMAVDEKKIMNELSFMKDPGHSGLLFHKKNSKKAALKPFNFHDRVNDSGLEILSKSSINKENVQVQFSHSFHTSHLRNRNNKENFCMKMAPKSDAGIRKKTFKF
ncbi:uncharacterized protein LOC129969142 isoform X2 [Argiope bruennichi]|uniref:uncharacterized protein LOC129969142 isoform X2 n=1 Tax=Argiope bruennichi TaxID=94029 RepID=UPI0024950DA0|nr:uncharacterized protein LOC129969142 isoform X2 [Argiope bruennichi]